MDEQKDIDQHDQSELEQYGVWVKAGPEEVLEAEDDYSMTDLVTVDDLEIREPDTEPDPFADLPDDGPDVDLDLNELQERLDDDYEQIDVDELDTGSVGDFDMSMPGTDEEIEDISIDNLDLDAPDLQDDEDLPELEGEEQVIPAVSHSLSPDEEEFLLEDDEDLQTGEKSAIPSGMDQVERDAFERIQTELTGIKQELAELKQVLREQAATLPRTEMQEPAASPWDDPSSDAPSGDVPGEDFSGDTDVQVDFDSDTMGDSSLEEPAAGGSGFFEDEEDETIALTGDELDNILNTAEFTEETGEAEELEDDFILDHHSDEGSHEEVSPDLELDSDMSDMDEPLDMDAPLEMAEPQDVDEPQDVELEPVERTSLVIEGDESAVDELAEMNIDAELADIDGLTDDSEEESPAGDDDFEEIELDLDALDDIGDDAEELELEDTELDDLDSDEITPPADDEQTGIATQEPDDEDFEGFAAAVEQDLSESPEDEITLDSPLTDELEIPAEPSPAAPDEEDAIDLDTTDMGIEVDEPDVEEIDFDLGEADELEIPAEAEEPAEAEDEVTIEIDLDAEDNESPEQEIAEREATDLEVDDLEIDDLEIDDLEVKDPGTDDLEVDDLEIDDLQVDDLDTGDQEVPVVESGEPEAVEDAMAPVDTDDEVEEIDFDLGETDELVIPQESADYEDDFEQDTDLAEEAAAPLDEDAEDGLSEDVLSEDALSEDEPLEEEPPRTPREPAPVPATRSSSIADLPEDLKQEIRAVLSYMDQLLEALPDDKIEEFAQSEHFEVYKHLFEELGLET